MMVVAIPMVGFTESSADENQGLVLDSGYWDMDWTEMVPSEGMTGYDALERVSFETDHHSAFMIGERADDVPPPGDGEGTDHTTAIVAGVVAVVVAALIAVVVLKRRTS